MKHKYHVKHRRNPLGVSGSDVSDIAYVSLGYVAGRAIPAMFLSNLNNGLVGYALNAAVGVAAKMVLGGNFGHDMMVGAFASAITRAVSDNFGTSIKGLSGDPAFTLGAYWPSYFAVPTVSDPYGRVSNSPYPAPALPAPAGAPTTVKGYMGAAGGRGVGPSNRFGGRYM